MIDLAVCQRPVVTQCLQRAWADVEHPAHVLIVHPLAHSLFSVPMADGIHPADETVELGDQFLKGLFFDCYDFHIVFLLVVTVSYAAKECIIGYPTMDFPKVAAYCVGVAVVVRGTDYRYHINFGF